MKPEILELIDSAMHNADADIAADLPIVGIDPLWDAHVHLDAVIAAAKAVRKAVDAELGVIIGEGGAARLDDFLVRYKKTSKLRVYSGEALQRYAGDDYARLFNPNNMKIGELKAIIKERGDNMRVIIDSLIEFEESDEPTVEPVPLVKAPQYAHAMQHGDIKDTRRRSA